MFSMIDYIYCSLALCTIDDIVGARKSKVGMQKEFIAKKIAIYFEL